MPNHRLLGCPKARIATQIVIFLVLPLGVVKADGPEPLVQIPDAKQQPARPPVGVVRGRVLSNQGVALPGVRVLVAVPAVDMRSIDPSSNHTVLETRSDANGDYRVEIPGLAAKTKVSIDAMMPGFQRLSGTLRAGGDARWVDVVSGAPPTVADLALKPARYFGGVVVDEQGQPVSGVQVVATVNSPQSMGYIEVTATKADGTFDIFGYPLEPVKNRFGDTKGVITFTHPSYTEAQEKDVYAINPDQCSKLRIVLPTGYKITGTVLGVDGKPVVKAMVEADVKSEPPQRKATLTDASGKFTLQGLVGGPSTITASALAIQQKTRVSMTLESNKEGLEVRLQPIVLPANLQQYQVLGMRLADGSSELQKIYDLYQKEGVVILDPGKDFERFNVGELAEGYSFFMVGNKRINSVREFVTQMLKETGGLDFDEYSIRVVYFFKSTEMVGSNTQHWKLTKDDIKQLQALADQFQAELK